MAAIHNVLVLVCAVLVAGSTAAPRPLCYWNAGLPGGGECWPRRVASGSIKGLPLARDLISRVWARSHANEVACMAYVDDKTKCLADTANSCAWDDAGSSCYGVDGTALRLLVIAKISPKSGYDVPRTLACPGTPAAEFLDCAWGGAKNLGRACTNPKCLFRTSIDTTADDVNSDCMPKSLASKSDAEVNAFYRDHIRSGKFDPKIWGSCEGLCLAQKAIACNKVNDDADANDPASRKVCEAKSYCSAGPSSTTTNCQLKLDTDAYGAAINNMAKVCAPRNQATCNATSLIESDPATAAQQRKLPLQAPGSQPFECKL